MCCFHVHRPVGIIPNGAHHAIQFVKHAKRLAEILHVCISEAGHQMVIDETGGLKIGVNNR